MAGNEKYFSEVSKLKAAIEIEVETILYTLPGLGIFRERLQEG